MELIFTILYIAFLIQCIAPRPDNSNAPFEIKSTISLNNLQQAVAEKMDRFPTLIRLQYSVPDINKAKDGFRSIQTEDELALFKIRMRPLIIHGILSSGHLLNHIPKNPTVLFTDASTESGDT